MIVARLLYKDHHFYFIIKTKRIWKPRAHAVIAIMKSLTNPPILAFPALDKPIRLHIDDIEIGSEAVLTHFISHVEKGSTYASHRWSEGTLGRQG